MKMCKASKFGFCKFGNLCCHKHVEKICEKDKCEIINCENRHPKQCRYIYIIRIGRTFRVLQLTIFTQCSGPRPECPGLHIKYVSLRNTADIYLYI